MCGNIARGAITDKIETFGSADQRHVRRSRMSTALGAAGDMEPYIRRDARRKRRRECARF
jgi:hypothetical protein